MRKLRFHTSHKSYCKYYIYLGISAWIAILSTLSVSILNSCGRKAEANALTVKLAQMEGDNFLINLRKLPEDKQMEVVKAKLEPIYPELKNNILHTLLDVINE